MKRFVLAVAFTCAMSATVLAGNIPTGDAPAPEASSSVVTTVLLTIISFVAG